MIFKLAVIASLFLFEFFVLPVGFGIFFASSLVVGASFLFIFLSKKSPLDQIPNYIAFIVFYDVFSPYKYGLVTVAFIFSVLIINLITLRINFEKNVKSGILFIGAIITIYYFALTTLQRFIA